MKAVLIPADGDKPLALVDIADRDDPLAYAAAINAAWIERVTTILTSPLGLVLLVDEEGIYADPQIHNRRASLLVGPRAHIVGDVLVVREDMHGEWRTVRVFTMDFLRSLAVVLDELATEAVL